MRWYTTPEALRTIRRLLANPPKAQVNTAADKRCATNAGYYCPDADALRGLYRTAFAKAEKAAEISELLDTNADEVLAALLGDPDRTDWAFLGRAASRDTLGSEIMAALAAQRVPA